MFVGLIGPEELHRAGVEHLAGGSLSQHGINGGAILVVGETHDGAGNGLIVLRHIGH